MHATETHIPQEKKSQMLSFEIFSAIVLQDKLGL